MGWAKPDAARDWQRIFGSRVRDLRLATGVSQMQLAHLADLDPAVEQGRRNIGLVNVCQIARALHVPVRDLFPAQRGALSVVPRGGDASPRIIR